MHFEGISPFTVIKAQVTPRANSVISIPHSQDEIESCEYLFCFVVVFLRLIVNKRAFVEIKFFHQEGNDVRIFLRFFKMNGKKKNF